MISLVLLTAAIGQLPQEVAAQTDRICLIRVPEGGGATSCGSGVILNRSFVASAAHVFRDAGLKEGTQCIIETPKGSYRGKLAGWKSSEDLACVRVEGGTKFPQIDYAPQVPGEMVYAAGHPGAGPLRWLSGRVSHTKYSNSFFSVGMEARQGQSGGPCFDSKGRLVGIISAAGGGETCYGRVAMHEKYLPKINNNGLELAQYGCYGGRCIIPQQPFNARIEPGIIRRPILGDKPIQIIRKQPDNPPAPIVDTPATKAPPTLEIDYDRLAEGIFERIAANPDMFRGPAGKDGAPGKDGVDGKDGKDGKDGETPRIDYDQLANEMIKRLPPVRINVLGSDKRVIQRYEGKLGGPPINFWLAPKTN